jgi:Tfp pilus assembly protein PilN
VLLAGECKRIEFDEFIRQQLVEVNVQYLQTPQIDTSALPEEMQKEIPQYSIAIATAWKMLDDHHPAFYPLNLLPESVREGQRSFKLGWHGYLLFLLIFLSTLLFTSRYSQLRQEIVTQQSTLVQLQEKQRENDKLKAAITGLSDQIDRYRNALAVYDSLVPGAERWNRLVAQLTRGIDNLGGSWVTEVRGTPQGNVSVQGYSLNRGRIPRIASIFDNATLARVEVKEIRDKTPPAYNFTIAVPPQPEKKEPPVAKSTSGSSTPVASNQTGTK